MNGLYLPAVFNTGIRMIRRLVILQLLVCAAALPVLASADSTETAAGEQQEWREELSCVVVTGTRSRADIRNIPLTVTVVGRPSIESSYSPSLLPVLTEQVPGFFSTSRGIMGYGVSDGAAGNISVRGLSGGSGQVMVLIDGHPQACSVIRYRMHVSR